MKKGIVLILAMLMLAVCNVTAQQNGERQGGRQGQRGPSPEYLAMIDSLNLDADQKMQFEALEEMGRKERQAMMKEAREGGKDRQEMRGEMQKMREKQTAVLENLFTEKQYERYTQFLKKEQASRGNRRGGGGRG